ncbi:hypothetical protein CRG98_022356 [Punica granatum]|uniref:Uncharacterized protein n=1 Tax=Punica granatum TaxID=22663 RepID=A0A2I0JLW6_PUNGR|nr:hypothetical protein CRG98_022356 [Punica granatum]
MTRLQAISARSGTCGVGGVSVLIPIPFISLNLTTKMKMTSIKASLLHYMWEGFLGEGAAIAVDFQRRRQAGQARAAAAIDFSILGLASSPLLLLLLPPAAEQATCLASNQKTLDMFDLHKGENYRLRETHEWSTSMELPGLFSSPVDRNPTNHRTPNKDDPSILLNKRPQVPSLDHYSRHTYLVRWQFSRDATRRQAACHEAEGGVEAQRRIRALSISSYEGVSTRRSLANEFRRRPCKRRAGGGFVMAISDQSLFLHRTGG